MREFFRRFIRASSFFRKEIFDVLRQPRLILTLVFGPFLILFLFGVGYHNVAKPLRTWFVAPDGSALAQSLPSYANSMGKEISFAGLSSDKADALGRLARGEVDLVIVAPQNAYNTVVSNQQAVFTIYYNDIDPIQVSYIQYIGVLFVDVVNRAVLASITSNGQKSSTSIHTDLQLAHQSCDALIQAVKNGDQTTTQQDQQRLSTSINAISLGVGASLSMLAGLPSTGGASSGSTDSLQATLQDLQQNDAQLNNTDPGSKDQRLASLDKIDRDLTTLDGSLVQFQSISPSIIINPFRSETRSIASIQPSQTDFYAPTVLALLLQHMALTFAALSIVRERNAGAMELFRVSPLSAGEALLGKYVSYMLFGLVIAAVLSALLIFGLHVPMLGSWEQFTLVVAALLFASMGAGFIISILSQTDSQAVQYSMIVLLASVFFSGFVISLDYLLYPVKAISWLLPTTYAGLMLRGITLRGVAPDWFQLGGLIAMGVVLMFISWLLMRRFISSNQQMMK